MCYFMKLHQNRRRDSSVKQVWTDEWIKKMWHMYTMEYYSAIKKKEIMSCAATWRDLEIIILSEVSQIKTNAI